jgi:hypothetical protein
LQIAVGYAKEKLCSTRSELGRADVYVLAAMEDSWSLMFGRETSLVGNGLKGAAETRDTMLNAIAGILAASLLVLGLAALLLRGKRDHRKQGSRDADELKRPLLAFATEDDSS